MDFDKENLKSLSNDDLFKAMKRCGLAPGPISQSTRSVYEKKLKNYLESIENGQTPNDSLMQGNSISVLSASSVNDSSSMNKNGKTNGSTENLTLKGLDKEPVNKRHTIGGYQQATQPKPNLFDDMAKNSNRNNDLPLNVESNPAPRFTQPEPIKSVPKYIPQEHQQPVISSNSLSKHVAQEQPKSTQKYIQQEPQESFVNSSSTSKYISQEPRQLNNYASSSFVTNRVQSQESIPKISTTEKRSNDLDFKLIKPVTNVYTVASTSTTSTILGRREINKDNYGLLDDQNVQPITLSSSYKFPEPTTNTRNRIVQNTKSEKPLFSASSNKAAVVPDVQKTSQVDKAPGKSIFNLKYLVLIGVLFAIVYFVMVHLQTNPESPVEFLN